MKGRKFPSLRATPVVGSDQNAATSDPFREGSRRRERSRLATNVPVKTREKEEVTLTACGSHSFFRSKCRTSDLTRWKVVEERSRTALKSRRNAKSNRLLEVPRGPLWTLDSGKWRIKQLTVATKNVASPFLEPSILFTFYIRPDLLCESTPDRDHIPGLC
ncbi:hypothetical protein MA16_Dca021252 [Dendrobium catenatum]|uniref:Uncharacterized protein n=1 Tax=Dendrobium catenatum TaxID=906689 RepID=A0A2I0VV70_9ASPA|nr:hypothetical protein MA16_Dca021252 [Dendrobium catenatum]